MNTSQPAPLISVPLHSVAHARAGDKGNRLNVCLMPYDPRAFDALAQQLSPEVILKAYSHRGAKTVRRYDLPLISAFNFVIDHVLEGGVNGSLNLDGHGKSNSFILLGLTVQVRPEWVRPHSSLPF